MRSLWNIEVLFFQAKMATQAPFETTPKTARQRMVTDTQETCSLPFAADEAIVS